MKKRNKIKRKTTAGHRRAGFVLAAVALLALAAITVISRQSGSTSFAKAAETKTASVAGKNYVIVHVAGRDVQVDPQTGQIRPLTPEEAQQLADGLKVMLNKSTDGLEQVQHADGSVSMDLQGRFQNVAVARVEADGTVTQSCVDEPLAGAQFFGIDPKLVGVETQNATQPVQATTTTVKKSLQ